MDFDIRKARRMYARSNKRKLTAQWSRHLAKMRKKLKKDAQDKKNKAALKALLDKTSAPGPRCGPLTRRLHGCSDAHHFISHSSCMIV